MAICEHRSEINVGSSKVKLNNLYLICGHLPPYCLICSLSQNSNCFILKYSPPLSVPGRVEGGRWPILQYNAPVPVFVCQPGICQCHHLAWYTKYFPTYFYNPDIFCLPFISFLFILRSHSQTRTSTECVTHGRELMNDTSVVARLTTARVMWARLRCLVVTMVEQAGRWRADILNDI